MVEDYRTPTSPSSSSRMDAADASAADALHLITEQNALVKTIKNGDWLRLLSNMLHASTPGFRTSFSLPPPTGRMHLYGRCDSQCAGLLFDRRDLDLSTSSTLAWPSGYFAKTEHHMHVQPDGEVQLTGGRWAHLTTIDELLRKGLEAAAAPEGSEPPLYNEISIQLTEGCAGLRAIFVRTSEAEDALFALGVRALIQHLFPSLPALPILRLTPTADAAIITRSEQLALLRCSTHRLTGGGDATGGRGGGGGSRDSAASAASDVSSSDDESAEEAASRSLITSLASRGAAVRSGGGGEGGGRGGGSSSVPRLPVDALAFPELGVAERLALHAAHGIGHDSLKETFAAILRGGNEGGDLARSLQAEDAGGDGSTLAVTPEGTARLAQHIAHCLCAAAVTDNVASAREVVRTAAPILLRPLLVAAASKQRAAPSPQTREISPSPSVGEMGEHGEMGAAASAPFPPAQYPAAPYPVHAVEEVLVGRGGGNAGAATRQEQVELLIKPKGRDAPKGLDQPEALQEVDEAELTALEESSSFRRRRDEEVTAIACVHSVLESVVTLKRACSAERSEGMLVALGAQITISEFVAGRTAQRLTKACNWLENWCRRAEPGLCSPASWVFLLSSWMEARKVDGNSDWQSFLTGKAVANRLSFHGELTDLLRAQQAGDGLRYIATLYALSSKVYISTQLGSALGLATRLLRSPRSPP